MPYYVSPEQFIKDKADFARKGISRGRSVVVLSFDAGILLVAENPSSALHKISEIYDRIAFAAVGKYNEFESLRVGGIRFADQRGFVYDRTDVTARSLANVYAQTLGTVFTESPKPFEVEIAVAEVGRDQAGDELFRISFDGSVSDENGYIAMGGHADTIRKRLRDTWTDGLSLGAATRLAREVLTVDREEPAKPASWEAAALLRDQPRRCFRRLSQTRVDELLSG